MPYTTHGRVVGGRAGIYTITNSATGRVYVGSTTEVSSRWSQHKCQLRGKRHPNKELQADWDTYGEDGFVFDMIEVIDMPYPHSQQDRDRLLEAERRWAFSHSACIYNVRIPDETVPIRISVGAAAQLQQLMLRQVPGVRTPEEMVEHLIKQALVD